MSMTIGELITALEDIRDSSPNGDNTEVRIAYQQNYPLAGTVAAITELPMMADDEENEDVTVAWIATGEVGWDENPYASSAAWTGSYADRY